MASIFVAEDEPKLRQALEDWLSAEEHEVVLVGEGRLALERISKEKFDLIILDVDLPGMNGMEICRQYRANGGAAGVLMLTGKDKIADKEEGFDAGADDYLTKPFNTRELSARLKALLRRPRENLASTLTVRDIVLVPSDFVVTKNGRQIQLLPKEFALLQFFMRNPDRVFSPNELLNRVWSETSEFSPDTVRGHIKRLREKIDVGGEPSIITTLHRIGYKLETVPLSGAQADAEE
jgi:DNA-binding response OmpR family regulator